MFALGGALGCALLAIAFLFGRISAKPAEPPRVSAREPLAAALPPNAAAPTVAPDRTQGSGPETGGAVRPLPPVGDGLIPLAREPLPPAASTTPRSPSFPDRPQIASYFSLMEGLEDIGAGDPQAFAKSLIDSATSGDFSSFDSLLAKSRVQRDRLRSMSPPPACAEHHRLARALAGESVSMLERLKAALVKGDAAALMTIATEGQALETQANQLKAMGEAIKRQAGL